MLMRVEHSHDNKECATTCCIYNVVFTRLKEDYVGYKKVKLPHQAHGKYCSFYIQRDPHNLKNVSTTLNGTHTNMVLKVFSFI